MKILFLVAYSELAASSRTRVYDYFPFLEKREIEYKYICFTPKKLHGLTSKHKSLVSKIFYYFFVGFFLKLVKIVQTIAISRSYDIIFIQKIIFPFGLEKLLKLLNKNIIFDFDDAIFTSDDKKNILNKIKINFQEKGFRNMLRVAKLCLVENEYNKNIAIKHCSWIETITGPIDIQKYFVKEKNTNSKIIIGWTGSPYTSKYLYEIKDVLKELLRKYNIILRFVGVNENFKKIGIDCEIKKWSLETEVPLIQSFDIGIMPLPENEWTRGKGGYKLLQYMACGIPAVASPVEINKEIVKDGVNGFLANSHKKWVEKISILIENEELRIRFGQAGRKTVEEKYSLEKASERMLSLFSNILESKK